MLISIHRRASQCNVAHNRVSQQFAMFIFCWDVKLTVSTLLAIFCIVWRQCWAAENFSTTLNNPHNTTFSKAIHRELLIIRIKILIMCRSWIWDQNGRHVQGMACCTNGRLQQHHIKNPIKVIIFVLGVHFLIFYSTTVSTIFPRWSGTGQSTTPSDFRATVNNSQANQNPQQIK